MTDHHVPPRSSYLFLNNLRLHYLRWGEPGGKQPLLLLHGLASNARIWALTAPYLAKAGFELIAPDLRGHGLTDKPEGDLSFDTYVSDLVSFITALELEHPILVGHSWGASMALDYAARFVTGPRSPAGLILIDGGFIQLNQLPGVTWEDMRERLTPPHLLGMPVEDFLNRLNLAWANWQPDEQALQVILANFEVREDETIAPRLRFEQHMQIVRAIYDFNTFERYQKFRCPALLIPARPVSPVSPDEHRFLSAKEAGLAEIQKLRPDIKLAWMLDSIHDIPLQYPARLAEQMISFITGL